MGRSIKERIFVKRKRDIFHFLLKISTILPNLEQNIDHKEIGTPKTHKSFLEDMVVIIIPRKSCLTFTNAFNTTKIQNLYCVGDSCFPGQGLNAVAF